MANNLYWAYVQFTNSNNGKRRPVLLIRESKGYYIVLRLSSKYENKPPYIQAKYIEVEDWRESGLTKPSWVDTYQTYELPIDTTKLTYIGKLSSHDLQELSKHFKL